MSLTILIGIGSPPILHFSRDSDLRNSSVSRLGEISKGRIIQSFSDTLVDFVEIVLSQLSAAKTEGRTPFRKIQF